MSKEFQASILRACARFIAKRLDPLELRLKSLEERGAVVHKGIDGRDGKDASPDEVAALVLRQIPAPKDGRDGRDGESVSVEVVSTLVHAEVVKATAGLTSGKDGKDGINGRDGSDGLNGKDGRDGIDGKDGSNGLDGKDGKDGEKGLDGRDGIDGKDGRDGIDGKDAPAVDLEALARKAADLIPPPKDGRDGVDGSNGIDGKDGVNGRDGTNGIDGKSVTIEDVQPLLDAAISKATLDLERRATDILQQAVDRMPKPENGRDGTDGLGFDDLDMEYDGERTFKFVWSRDGQVREKSFRAPVTLYRGTYEAARVYEKDDTITYGGSLWIALRNAPGKPGEDEGWKLCVKRGRDAKGT